MYQVGVFAAIFNDQNQVLLCHRNDYDLWNLPGGGLESDESPWDGVVREVKEETGLDVKVTRLAGIYHKPQKQEIVFQFICEIIGGEITLNDEADKINYFSIADIPKNTSPKQVMRIHDILENPSTVVMKTHTGKSSIDMIKEGLL
jgi:ADP-ribose pyrophosphatase YjhB (NUDIX family)